MSFARPFLLAGWLAAAAIALAGTAPRARQPNTLNGPIHILTER